MNWIVFLIGLFFVYLLTGWAGFFLVTIPIVAFFIYDFVKYPNKFRGKCKYCGVRHGRNKWWHNSLGEVFSHENGYIFLSKSCFEKWDKENFICDYCNKVGKYSERTITHKFKRDRYYYCSNSCKIKFKGNNPKLFYEGYQRHSIPSELRKIVFKRDNGKCKQCGSGQDLHFDHIIPVSKGGATSENNLELLCQACNLSKSDRIE